MQKNNLLIALFAVIFMFEGCADKKVSKKSDNKHVKSDHHKKRSDHDNK